MSALIPRQLLAQLLSRFLKLLASIRGLPFCRSIIRLLAFLVSLRRRTRTNPRRPTHHQDQGPPNSSATLDNGVVCAMNVPSSGPSDAHERSRPSPVDLPYTSAEPSGHLTPYAPAPARRYSRDCIPWMTGSQTSLHDVPSSMNHDAHVVGDSILHSSSSTTTHTHHDNHTPTSDILTPPFHPPGPLHRTFDFTPETLPGNPDVKTSPQAAHNLDTNESEPHRSGRSLSARSSQLSVSQKSSASRNSIGRASYRKHCGPPARVRTPGVDQDATFFGPSCFPALESAEPGSSATADNIISPPNVDDSNQPGEPIRVGNRFFPISVNAVPRYDNRAIR